MYLSDAYQHFTILEILSTLNFFASIVLRFSFGTQIGQACSKENGASLKKKQSNFLFLRIRFHSSIFSVFKSEM